MKTIAYASLAMCIAACGSIEYAPDLAGKPTARIRVASTSPSVPVYPRLLEGKLCTPFAKAVGMDASMKGTMSYLYRTNANKESDAKLGVSIGIPMTDTARNSLFTEHRIVANTPVTLEFTGAANVFGASVHCNTAKSFKPEAAADYEAVFSWANNQCTVILQKVDIDSSNKVRLLDVPGATMAEKCR